KLIGLLEHLFVRVAAKHEVGDPDGEAIDDDGVGVGTRVAYAPDELGGLLDRAPVTGALRAMPLDPFVHFRVAGERRRHEAYARVRRRPTHRHPRSLPLSAPPRTRVVEVMPGPSREHRAEEYARGQVSWLSDRPTPRAFPASRPVAHAGFVPDHSDGVAADSHRLPWGPCGRPGAN